MIRIAVANQKGGVGKTTSAIHIGAGLAAAGQRTIIIDTDPQGHVALALGLPKGAGLYNLLVDGDPLAEVVQEARSNLWIIPSDKRTEKANRYLTSLDYREQVLADALPDKAPYDIALFDLAPSLTVLHIAALAASDMVIIPCRLDHLAMDGVNEILRTIAEVNRHGGHISEWFVVPTFFERVTNETQTQLEALAKAFPSRVWPPIPADTRLREASVYGQTAWEYAPKSPAIAGIQIGSSRVGGYGEVVQRIQGVLGNGR
jgi:chromosome partitioning protein